MTRLTGRDQRLRNRTACSLAHMAVGVAGCRAIGAVLVRFGALVLMGVVADMHALGAFLVRAVRRSRSPEGLQRQQQKQEDGEPAAH